MEIKKENKSLNERFDVKLIIILLVIVGLLILMSIIPFILEYKVFRSDKESVLTNGEWSSFLGSFIGGIIGTIGTLVAVLFTTLETRKIQKESNENLQKDRDARVTEVKRELVNKIVNLVGEYIADISAFFYSVCECQTLLKRKEKVIKDISDIDGQIVEKYSNQERTLSNIDLLIENNNSINVLEIKKSKLVIEIEDIVRHIQEEKRDSYISNKCLFTIKIILQDINCASELITQLDRVHSIAADANNQSFERIVSETNKLMDLTSKFSVDYLK